MSDQEATARESETLQETDILSLDGVPFGSKAAAAATRSAKYSSRTHDLVPVSDGWVLRPIPKEKLVNSVPTPGKDGQEAEKVYWVRIRPASDNISKNARVAMPGVNGEMLYLRRGGKYPIPERFLNAMAGTLHPVSRHVLGQDRMEQMWVQDDQYDVQGEATWADYKKWAAETDYGRKQLIS